MFKKKEKALTEEEIFDKTLGDLEQVETPKEIIETEPTLEESINKIIEKPTPKNISKGQRVNKRKENIKKNTLRVNER